MRNQVVSKSLTRPVSRTRHGFFAEERKRKRWCLVGGALESCFLGIAGVMLAALFGTTPAAVYQRMYRYRQGLYSLEHHQALESRRDERKRLRAFRLGVFAWMSVYYRQVSQQPGFFAHDTNGRWQLLREAILADAPQNDPSRMYAVDGVHESDDRAEVLAWLEEQRQQADRSSGRPPRGKVDPDRVA
jgi:hypothetical protein